MLHTKSALSSVPTIEPVFETLENSSAKVDVEKLIEALTPDLMIIRLENTEVKSLNKHNSFHYHLLLHHVEVKGKFKISNSSRVRISNLRIHTPAHEFLHSKEISIDVKSNGNIIVTDTKFDTLNVIYNHEDIYGWFLKILTAGMKSSRKELILKAFRMATEKMVEFYHSEFTQNLFRRIVLNNLMEFRNVALVFQLDDQISSLNVSKAKILLNQFDKLRRNFYENYTMNLILKDRHWDVEIISDGPLCFYMDQKYNYLNCDSQKTYLRGSALFVGSAYICAGSHEDAFKLDLHVNTLRTEYSLKLKNFIVQSIKSCREFIDLFSQLKSVNRNDEGIQVVQQHPSLEDVLKEIQVDVRVTNISLFFINRHDVCTFINLSEFSSLDSFNYTMDTLQVSTVDFTKYESVYDLSEFSSVYVSTKTLKVNLCSASNDQPQIGVDFAEKLECKWDAHFLRHLLSLIRDFRGFRQKLEDAVGISREHSSLLPRALPVGLDIKKIRNIRIQHADVNVDKLFLLINELSGENLFFYHYFH